ncbi:MAG: ABC transporter substrate-binding protein [Deltaproteobacteria bacterium]|nr:ABC transporter substrate-binding protein [Deltaproteobacteria bacterium]
MKGYHGKWVVLSAFLILMVLGLPGGASQAAETEIVWASVDDFSGPYAATAEEANRAIRLFLEERGYKVGPYKVKYITRDTELKPAVGVRRLQEVIAEAKPMVIFSACSSAVQLAMCDIVGKNRKVIFWTDGWDTRLTGENGNRNTFRWASPNYTIARASLSAFLDKYPSVKKVIIISLDYAWGYDIVDNMKPILEKRGVKILKTQFIPVNATDASVYMTEAKGSGADAYLICLYGKLFGIGLRQAHEFGLKKTMKIFSTTGTFNMLRGVGSEALESMYLGDHWNHAMNNEWSRKFSEGFKKKWGVFPGDYAAAVYLECQLMERVIKQTGSADIKVLIPALEKIGEFAGPTGKETMVGWQHQIAHDFLLLRGKATKEKKYEDDFVEVIGGSKVYPKQGETGFSFDRTKEDIY